MAIDVCSEVSSAGISPRVSFSYDLNRPDVLSNDDYRRRSDLILLDSSSDFVFCIGNRFAQELAPADELFSDGKIRAKEIKRKVTSPDEPSIQSESVVPSRRRPPCSGNTERKQLKEFLSSNFDPEEKPPSKSFWQFKRSSSLNFDSAKSRCLIRSLQFLSRSNSTGSVPNNSKQATISKGTQKPNLQKQPSVSRRKSSASCPNTYYSYSSSQRHYCTKIKNCGAYGDGVRISPVLNLPPPCISRVTVSFFGFGSLFCNGKAKNMKK